MNKLEQAAQQALEALESAPVQYDFNSYPMLVMTPDTLQTTLTALREVLEQRIKVTAAEVVAYRDLHCVTMAEAKKRVQEMKTEQAEQEPVGVVNPNGGINWRVGQEQLPPRTKLYAAPVRTKDLTEPLIDELRECRDLLMCVESCSRNNFENLAYERVQAIDAVIAADIEKNK